MIISQPKEGIAEFVSILCGKDGIAWANYTTIGLVRNGVLVAGVVYDKWGDGDVCMHVGGTGKFWLNREFLFAVFDYPFNQIGCRRVTGLVPADNFAAKRFDEHLGFVQEGCMRKGTASGDLLVYGMLKEECRWLNIKLKEAA